MRRWDLRWLLHALLGNIATRQKRRVRKCASRVRKGSILSRMEQYVVLVNQARTGIRRDYDRAKDVLWARRRVTIIPRSAFKVFLVGTVLRLDEQFVSNAALERLPRPMVRQSVRNVMKGTPLMVLDR